MRSEGVGHGEPQPVELMPGRVEALIVVLQLSIELLQACNHAIVRARQHTALHTCTWPPPTVPCGCPAVCQRQAHLEAASSILPELAPTECTLGSKIREPVPSSTAALERRATRSNTCRPSGRATDSHRRLADAPVLPAGQLLHPQRRAHAQRQPRVVAVRDCVSHELPRQGTLLPLQVEPAARRLISLVGCHALSCAQVSLDRDPPLSMRPTHVPCRQRGPRRTLLQRIAPILAACMAMMQ